MQYQFQTVKTVDDPAERRLRLAQLYAVFEASAESTGQSDNSTPAQSTESKQQTRLSDFKSPGRDNKIREVMYDPT